MKIDKPYITTLINEAYEQIVMNELFSKRSASLEEIMDGDQNPSTDDVIKSDHFQENLFKDLINNKDKKFSEWKIDKKKGSLDDITSNQDESFPVSYTFKFTYNYKDNKVERMSIIIKGDVEVNHSSDHSEEADVDSKHLGDNLDIKLFHDGNNIPLRRLDGKEWMTPTIKKAVVNAILSPYL